MVFLTHKNYLILLNVIVLSMFLVGCTKKVSDADLESKVAGKNLIGEAIKSAAINIKKVVAYKPGIQITKINGTCPGQKGCIDTDQGRYEKYIAGRVMLGSQTGMDYCKDDLAVMEYSCYNNAITSAPFSCSDEGGCYQGRCKYLGCSKLRDKECIQVMQDCSRFVVFAPKGYEPLAQGHLQDLEYCYPALSEFIGITPVYEGVIALNLQISDIFRGSSDWVSLNYQAPEKDLTDRLNEFLTHAPDGFLYHSSPTYCANTHELTHVFTGFLPLPEWASEGIAEYTQKYKQAESKADIECRENGWYGTDWWGDNGKKLFPYFDLFPGNRNLNDPVAGISFYHTSMCLWEYVDTHYGAEKRKEIFQKLKNRRNEISSDNFVDAVMRPILGDQAISKLQEKFGI